MTHNPDMSQIMRQAQKMQEQLAKAQAELSEQEFQGTPEGAW
jgi:DNA-binding protein YbaB